MECVTAGQLNADGPCTLFTKVNDNGIVLFECSDVTYTPAACPDDPAEGVFAVGPAAVKIASVDGTVPDVLVQRDANSTAHAANFQTDGATCAVADQGTLISPFFAAIGPVAPGPAQVRLRLRGNGDIPTYGGVNAQADMGVFDLFRTPGVNGGVFFDNHGNPGAAIGGMFFRLRSDSTFELQDLVWLTTTAGTLFFPAWTYVSDVRLKANVSPLDVQKALQVILGITPIAYEMHGQKYNGFSAQDVQAVLPDAVKESADKGPMTMRDGDILANLVAAVKYLTARVEALEAKAGA